MPDLAKQYESIADKALAILQIKLGQFTEMSRKSPSL